MKVFAHRGASGHEPENTLLAIKAALDMKVDAIEIDVRQVQNKLVVIHDRWLQKTTNGEGRVRDKNFRELRRLDAGKGQKIPTLWEVLKLVNGRCELNVELKSEGIIEPLITLLHKAIDQLKFVQSQFLISSFNHHLLRDLKKLDYNWRIGALTACLPLDYSKFAEELQADSIHIDVDFVDQKFVDDAHGRGIKVYVYTVDQEDDVADLVAMKVDGIFTNFPTRSMVQIAHLKNH